MQLNSIAEFLLYAMPGFVALEIYRFSYPVRTRAEYSSIAWSLVYGVVISYSAIAINNYYLRDALHYAPGEMPSFPFLIVLLVLGALVGLARVALRKVRLKLGVTGGALGRLRPDPGTVWAKVNAEKDSNWAVVFLEDGAIYLGFIESYTNDPDAANKDFLLADARRVDEDLSVKYAIAGPGVYLNTKNVTRLEYYRGVTGSDPSR